MIGRRGLLVLAAALPAGPALAQVPPAGATVVQPQPAIVPATPARPVVRRRRRAPAAQPVPPPAPVARYGDPAPVPNHDMEAPRGLAGPRSAAQLAPVLIDPAEPQIGTARDRASLRAREDRLLRQPAAGARLRLPFEY